MHARGSLLQAMLVSTLLSPASSALAQDWQVDLGGTSVRYDSVTTAKSASLSPQIEWNGSSILASASGSLAALESSAWTGRGEGDLSTVLGPARRLRGWGPAALLTVAGSVHSGGSRTSTSRVESRAQFNRSADGAWLGIAAGTGWNSSGGGVVGFWGPTAGLWKRRSPWTFTVTATPIRLGGSWFPEVDAQFSGTRGRGEFTGYAGWRSATSASGEQGGGWIGASITTWIATRLALVVSGGSYPADIPQALPGGRYLTISLRFAGRQKAPLMPVSVRQTILLAERNQGRLQFLVPGAVRVDLAGDWTGWERVAMEHSGDGRWLLPVRLPSGVYRFNLVVDGGRWIVPEGYASVDDGFGGKTALLVVP